MYYRWENIERDLCPEIIEYTQLDIDDIAAFYYTKGGQALSRPLPEITFQVDGFGDLFQRDSLWAGMPYLVFSPRLRRTLEQAGVTNIEYYPARIQSHATNEATSDYMIANIVGLVPCLDWKRADCTFDTHLPDRIKEITHLVLDLSKIPEHFRLFRLAERRTVILCRQEVRDLVTDKGITGVQFVPVDSAPSER